MSLDCDDLSEGFCIDQMMEWQRQIEAVVLGGRYHDRAALDTMLSRVGEDVAVLAAE